MAPGLATAARRNHGGESESSYDTSSYFDTDVIHISSGSTDDYCGRGCQAGYGVCGPTIPPVKGPVSTDGRCGAKYGNQVCKGSKFGDCCSQYEYVSFVTAFHGLSLIFHSYCGGSSDYCDAKTCQKTFGTCNGASPSSALPTTLSSVVASSRPGTCSPITVTLPATTIPGQGFIVTVTALSTGPYPTESSSHSHTRLTPILNSDSTCRNHHADPAAHHN